MATPPDFSVGQVLTSATMNKVGLWLIEAKDFTNATTVQFDNCFSADFRNYRLLVNVVSSVSTNTGLLMRYGNGSTFSDTGIYGNAITFVTTAGASGVFNNTNTGISHVLNQIGGDKMPTTTGCDIFQPFLAQRTTYTLHAYGSYNSSGLETRVSLTGTGFHDTATSYASLRIFNGATSNMTGRAAIYGYND